jgi:hypothetical protein
MLIHHRQKPTEVIYRILVGRPEGKKSSERPRCMWDYNINMDLMEIGFDVANGFGWLKIDSNGEFS